MSEPARRVLRRMVPSYLNGKGDRMERKKGMMQRPLPSHIQKL